MRTPQVIGSVALSTALAGGALVAGATAASAAVPGTSDAVITCDRAHEYDPDLYPRPGFVCEIDPAEVTVGGIEHGVVRYRLVVRDGDRDVVESPWFDYGLDPAPVFLGQKPFDFGATYDVDYKAVLDDGRVAIVRNDEFQFRVPRKPATPAPRVRYGALKDGLGKGYTVRWDGTKRTAGYKVKAKIGGGKWFAIDQVGKHRAEVGRIPRADRAVFKVRAWNAGGYGSWAQVRD